MKKSPRFILAALLVTLGLIATDPTPATAQNTIADGGLELTFGKGSWLAFLPEYEWGQAADGDAAFEDDNTQIGSLFEFGGAYRFANTRTSIEANGFFAFSFSEDNLGTGDIEIPSLMGNGNAPFAAAHRRIDSEVYFYGGDFNLRDTWQSRYGGLSAGGGLSLMSLDQEFDLDLIQGGVETPIEENVNSDYVGGHVFVGWDGCFLGRASTLDLVFGYYDLDAEYDVKVNQAGVGNAELSKAAFKLEVEASTRFKLFGCNAGLTAGGMYLSDVGQIVHPIDGPAALTTDDALVFTGTIDLIW